MLKTVITLKDKSTVTLKNMAYYFSDKNFLIFKSADTHNKSNFVIPKDNVLYYYTQVEVEEKNGYLI